MPDGNTVATIYATTVIGFRVRKPGIVHVGLGLDGFEDEEPHTVAQLALPTDVARSLAASLTEAVAIADAPSEESGQQADTHSLTAIAGAGLFALRQLLALVAAEPAFAERLDEFQRRILNNTRNMVTEGVPIHEEADAMRAAIEVLEQMFEQVRRERTDPDHSNGPTE